MKRNLKLNELACEAFIHGFRATAKKQEAQTLVNYIVSSTKEQVEWRSESPTRSGRTWGGSAKGTAGSMFWFDTLEEKGDFGVAVSGKACERMGLRNTWRLIVGLSEWYKCKFTRIDCKVRVPSELVSPRQLFEVGKFGNFSGCVNLPEWRESPSKVWVNGKEFKGYAGTCYYGSRESEAFMRIYDPYNNHGAKDSTDIEIEYKKGKAVRVAQMLCSLKQGVTFEDIASMVASLAVSHFDFIDRSKGDKNLSRCPRLPFWQRVLDFIGAMKQKVDSVKVEPSLQKFRKYMERSVMGGLEALCQVYGNSSIYAWMQSKRLEKKENMPARWLALVAEAQNDEALKGESLSDVQPLLHPCDVVEQRIQRKKEAMPSNVSIDALGAMMVEKCVHKYQRRLGWL